MATQETDRVNHLNIALMAVAAVAAYLFPFGLFLLAYTVLGPLHYVTEISWLHDRTYFTRHKRDFMFLAAIALVAGALVIGNMDTRPIGITTAAAVAFLTYLAFTAALVFAFVRKAAIRVAAILAAGLVGCFFIRWPSYVAIFGLFLPTLVHVSLFTALFILAGALKGRSFSGFLSLAVFLGISAGLLLFHPERSMGAPGDTLRDTYGVIRSDGTPGSPFIWLNYSAARVLKWTPTPRDQTLAEFAGSLNAFLYQHPAALALMSFIAFAYTYHYFNWFSKTSIIRWHEVSKRRMAGVLCIWAASLALYAIDYKIGLSWLFLLSFAHVLLEFPLNHVSVAIVGAEVRGIVSGKPGSSV